MNDSTLIKETDWYLPKNIETPEGPESGPMIYKIFKTLVDTKKQVSVGTFIDELSKVMRDYEERLRIHYFLSIIDQFAEEEKILENTIKSLTEIVEDVYISNILICRDTRNIRRVGSLQCQKVAKRY